MIKDIRKLLDFLEANRISFREDMTGRECTTFKTGGPIPVLSEPRSLNEASLLLGFAESNDIDFFLIGNGSNLLIPDEGSDRLFIRLSGELSEYCISENELSCGAGASLAAVSKYSVSCGLMGLEWASGIPGTVGGAVAMNASAYGGEIRSVLSELTVYSDGEVRTVSAEPDKMGYRTSAYAFPNMVVLKAVFTLEPDDGNARERMEQYNQKRKNSQPLSYPSAGSTFKRPQGYYAGALIEQAGLKGTRVGGACVSEKHAGFIINDRGASSSDVTALMEIVRNRVMERFGVMLEPEVIVLR